MPDRTSKPFLPPRWVIRTIWAVHRSLYRVTKRGLRRPRDGRAGMLRLRTSGRLTGKQRAVIVCYFNDGDHFVTLAMNGWSDPAPAWWLNLQAQPLAEVDTKDGVVRVRGREATGDERDRLWAAFERTEGWGEPLDQYSALRSHPTPVVVLEPA
jgi:deazaflavin-dependent oxidoreductase (nitroreductase family)